ncbi:Cell cycle serine/threonine-protein kinase cdc5/MSD2 [Glugoides intestinalis]
MGTRGELYFPHNTQITDPMQATTYTIKKLIGRGAYAQCFLVTVDTGENFAMKIIRLADLKSEKVLQKLQSEISIHSSLDHPSIVKLYTSFRSPEYVFMILELCERGALDELLKRNGKLKEKYVSKFVSQLVKGLVYLHHQQSVVHRDLKLANLFLDSNLNLKIGDFGLSAIIKDGEKRKTVCGTPNYIAPEVLFGKTGGHSFEADIWSLGVIIYTLLVGTPPFQQKKVEEIYRLIELNKYIFPEDCVLTNEAIDIISKILISNPVERPDLEQIMRHKFLTQKENLTYRVYKNLLSRNYTLGPLYDEHVIFSMPINAFKGIGYVLKSGICGVFYQDLTNAYLKRKSLIFIKMMHENTRKVFVTEEHLVENIPQSLELHYTNILYFITNFASISCRSTVISQSEQGSSVFVAKIKKIKDGLLFIMTNFVFIFDFNDGSKVAIGQDGMRVYCFNDDGPIEFSRTLQEACLAVLKSSCTSS